MSGKSYLQGWRQQNDHQCCNFNVYGVLHSLETKQNLSSLNNSMTVAMQRKRRSNAAFSVSGAMAATNIFLFDCWQEWKPILDSWAIHEKLAFNWKIHWKNASTDVLFELLPSHEATLPTLTPRHCKRLNLAISAITKSSLLASQSWKMTLGGTPLSTSMRKKKHGGGARYKSRNSSTKVLNKGLSAGFLSSDNGTRAQGGGRCCSKLTWGTPDLRKMTEKKQLILWSSVNWLTELSY